MNNKGKNVMETGFARKIICMFFSVFISGIYCFAENVLGIKGGEHTSVGIYIKDLRNDSVVFESNVDRCLTPASITKAYTTATAVNLLPRDFRFETKVYLTGDVDCGVLNGNIIIKASGDPTLESEHFPENKGFIRKIVNSLTEKGITKINGDVILERVNENHQYPEGPLSTWNIDDVPWDYGCGIFDFNWCDNYLGIYPATGKMTSPDPNLQYEVWDKPWNGGLTLQRGIYSDFLVISGKQYSTNPKARVNTSMPYPFDVFKSKLIDRLTSNGIAVKGDCNDNYEKKLLITHKSPKLDEILRSLMIRSDNMFAEGILRVLGKCYGNLEESLNTERDFWKTKGFEPEYNRVLDGSGLSRADAISPKFLAGILEWMVMSENSKRYVSFFPVAGRDGTMKTFMAKTPLKGRLALKTGSVNAVQCYAGYLLDESGKPSHVIVFMANNFFCSRSELKDALSSFLLEKLNYSIVN